MRRVVERLCHCKDNGNKVLYCYEEVAIAIESFSDGKKPEKDGITNEMIKASSEEAGKILHRYLKRLKEERVFPNDWKTAVIKFII